MERDHDASADDALLAIGKVVEVRGNQIIAELELSITELSRVYRGQVYDIGQFGSMLRIKFGRRMIFAIVSRLRMKAEYELERMGKTEAAPDERVLEADLIGQGYYVQDADQSSAERLVFERGVTTYPLPLQTVYLTPRSDLRQIYAVDSAAPLELGTYTGVDDAPCILNANEFLGKHSAILGSTGTGKSACVATVLTALTREHSPQADSPVNPKIVVLDPHGEYKRPFPDGRVLSTDDSSLRLPLWILTSQQTIELIVGRSERAATNQANIVKDALAICRNNAADSIGIGADNITVDSPVPYALEALESEISKSKPSQESKQGTHNAVLEKIRVLREDSRMAFMMTPAPEGDSDPTDSPGETLVDVMQQFLGHGYAPAIVDLSGVPSEVAGTVAGTIAQVLFAWRLWQTDAERKREPIVLVCEEAHLYVPSTGTAQFADAQYAIRRIVREGRKYGLGLMLVSQRPSEIDESVLSQCSSWIVLRITNERDQSRIRAALPESMAGLASALPSLRRQEAVVLGQGIALPARIRVRDLSEGELPVSQDADFVGGWRSKARDVTEIERIARRWQTQGKFTDSDGVDC